QEQRKGPAAAGNALQFDGAAQQFAQTTADRQAQARAAVFPARRPFRLLESLEDDILLLLWNTDTRIADGEGDHLPRFIQRDRTRLPVTACFIDLELHLPFLRKLK